MVEIVGASHFEEKQEPVACLSRDTVCLFVFAEPCWQDRCHTLVLTKTRIGILKGLFTIFLFSVRSHILNSNGVWYFARRGLKMPQTQDFWVFILSPGDLDSRRQGTLT